MRSNYPPKRRALHERTPSQTNETSPTPSLRMVKSWDRDQEEQDMYSATPYPTKPEQILLPRPGKGQEYASESHSDSHTEEGPSQSTGTLLTDYSHLADSSLLEQSVGWDSSTVDAGNTPSQVWEEDPASSKSSLPEPVLPGEKPDNHHSDEASEVAFSDDDMELPTAAPTIKTVVSEPPSRHPSNAGTSAPATVVSANSSPNVVPLGPPSSPNFVAYDSSSLNFVRIGSSNPGSAETRSNSLSSMNSLGTVVRHVGAAQWTHGSSSEQSSGVHSFHSSPPFQSVVGSFRSGSTHPSHQRSQNGSGSSSSRSAPSSADPHANVHGGLFIQYPIIREPSSSSSWVDTSRSVSDRLPEEPTLEPASSSRVHSHLSTVPSQWSAEYDNSFAGTADQPSDNSFVEPPRPTAALGNYRTGSSSMWLVTHSDSDEHLDNISSLPVRGTHARYPSMSSSSRRSSLRSIKRPGTASSVLFNALPTWARMYYQGDEKTAPSALSLVDGSRPSSARPATANSNILQRIPTAMTRPKTRHGEITDGVTFETAAADPRDPRAHWVKGPEPERAQTPRYPLRNSWSPHLYPDQRVARQRGSAWGAPSLDSRTEPLLGRRNIQVWSFCFGFVFPLTWFIAAFLPLPPKPETISLEDGPELEMALRLRLLDLERRRYQNARWWRNLNRWMTPLGLVIITIIITLAVVGTKLGF
ncbi:hypothetical protein MW887_005206 [Aspergillus wentii]|nr:hypothetical protein MW887_005206 [Aspergillus wentii]